MGVSTISIPEFLYCFRPAFWAILHATPKNNSTSCVSRRIGDQFAGFSCRASFATDYLRRRCVRWLCAEFNC